jgi:hypothetical protein
MQALFIIYHEDLEQQVRRVVDRGMAVPRYTRIDNVIGARMVQEEEATGYMTDRRNQIILVLAEEGVVEILIRELQILRRRSGHGLRGFVLDTKRVF